MFGPNFTVYISLNNSRVPNPNPLKDPSKFHLSLCYCTDKMQCHVTSTSTLLILLVSVLSSHYSHGGIFTFEMHHRYSEQVRRWSKTIARSHSSLNDWPLKGTIQYYADLAERDRFFRGRRISEIEEPVTFSDGNSTFRISSLGFLHYATVTLGTPGMKFLVALDTGSDLFWVPCDCTRCAPIQGTTYGSEFELSIYHPKESSTSKKVSCNNSLCLVHDRCSETLSHCPYVISYVSAETSTSGILVEDVLHLTTEDHQQELIEAYITFGCGQVQTGSFLDVAAPNGLFGLGMEKVSVPSVLSREGFTADSFSMCFGRDGVGRISFGDKGTPQQVETPFNVNPLHPTYNITVTQLRVGASLVDVNFTVLFDSGTSFTYLVDPIYKKFSDSFHSQAKDKRRATDSRIPFEYCYNMNPDANTSLIPSVSLTMQGGSLFTVYDPIIIISTQNELIYCLAVVRSPELNILGQNFMTGYRVVFDREKLVLGWQSSDCYDIHWVGSTVGGPNSTHLPSAAVAAEPGKNASSKPAGDDKGTSQGSAASPSLQPLNFCFTVLIRLLLILFPLYRLS